MTDRIRPTLAAVAMLAALGGCDRAARAPRMDAADLSDGGGARTGDFPAANGAAANDAMAAAVGNAP